MSAAWRRLPPAVRTALTVVAVFAVWYVLSFLLRASGDPLAASKLPFPHEIAERFVVSAGSLSDAAWSTAARAVLGFAIGAVVGLVFGTVMVQARWIEASFLPYLLAAQMIPLIALVPILRAVLRDGDLVRLYVASFVTFVVITVAVLRGLKNVERNAVELMDSLNAGRLTTLRYLRFPSALPYIFAGLRIAAPLSLVGSILVDFLGARNGLGFLMVAAVSIGGPRQATLLWAAMLISLALGYLFTRVVAVGERRMSFWQPAYRAAMQ